MQFFNRNFHSLRAKLLFYFQWSAFSFILIGCIQKSNNEKSDFLQKTFTLPTFHYLEGAEFILEKTDTFLVLKHPQNSIVYNTIKLNSDLDLPIRRVVTLSATHVPFIEALGEIEIIKGMASPQYSLSKAFVARVENDKVLDVSGAEGVDFEKVVNCDPDVLLIYPFGAKNYSRYEDLNIHVLNITEYLEVHPLAKAEWIKVFGFLLDVTEKGDSIFKEIETAYLKIKKEKKEHQYTAMVGEPFKNQWNQPSGRSYMAHLLADAGFQYVWKDSTIDKNLELDFEEVYAASIEADYWFMAAPKKEGYTLNDLIDEDIRYAELKSVKEGNVYLCNTAVVDYFGVGGIQPDVLLEDFLKASQKSKQEGIFFKRLRFESN